MDFITIDTIFGKKFYLLLIMQLKSRKIVQWKLTQSSNREFVRQQIVEFTNELPEKVTLIHDNGSQFTSIDFSQYDVKAVNTSVAAPNMNAYVERLIGTVRREALDHFLLFSVKQVKKIISEFVDYYNFKRVHQGIDKIPDAEISKETGTIKKQPILSGLFHHYYRSSA